MIDKKMDLENLAERICELPLMEVSKLVEILKEKLNIQDIPMMASAPAAASNDQESKSGGNIAKEEVTLILKSFHDDKKVAVIKALREIKKKEGVDIGVKQAKEMVESCPVTVCENIPVAKSEEYSQLLKDAGANVEYED